MRSSHSRIHPKDEVTDRGLIDPTLNRFPDAYGGREEIADAVQALLYEEMRKGATLADAIERITPERSDQFTPIPTIAC